MPGWKTSGHNVGNVVKHNSEGEVNVITIFGNYNIASRGTQRIQTATQQLPAHRKTSSQNSQKGSVQLGIFSTKFARQTQTAQVMPNNCKSSTSSTTTTTTTASKKTPRPGNNTVHFIQILTTTAITKSKTKSKVADETLPPRYPRGHWAVKKWGLLSPQKQSWTRSATQ